MAARLDPDPFTPAPALALLERIERFPLSGDDEAMAFEARLADDNGWTLGYATAVTAEYRRFLVLTQVAGHAVSPSPDVDEAWHLHLTRTVDYEALCREVFGRFLHHEPARGGGDAVRYRTMYADTLAAYRRAFDRRPPDAIWPEVDRRHAAKPSPAAMPAWTVPFALRRGHRLAFAAIALAGAVGWMAHGTGVASMLPSMSGPAFIGVALCGTPLLAWLAWRGGSAARESTARDMLDPYEAAWLSGGARRMTATAIATLAGRGVLLARPAGVVSTSPPIGVNMSVPPDARHPAEQACLSAIADGGLRFGAANMAVEPVAWRCEQRLIAAGIATDDSALPVPRALALAGATLLLLAEVGRLAAALGTSRPVGLLVVLMILEAALIFIVSQRLGRAGSRAEAVLKRLRLANGTAREAPREGEALSFAVALVGAYALSADARFIGLGKVLGAPSLSGLRDRGAWRSGGKGSTGGSDCSSCGTADVCGSSCGSADAGPGDGCGSSCSGGSSCGGGGGD